MTKRINYTNNKNEQKYLKDAQQFQQQNECERN